MLIVYLLLVALSYIACCYDTEAIDTRGRWYDVLFLLFGPGSLTDALSSPFAVLIAFVGVTVFCGMLISVMSNVLQRRVESFVDGETDYRFSNHIVILGFNKSVPSLLEYIHRHEREGFIVLMCSKEIKIVRDWLHAHLADAIEDRLVLLNGAIDAEDDLARLKLEQRVRKIYVLGEDDHVDHDAVVLECTRKLAGQKIRPHETVECHVQIDDLHSFFILQRVDYMTVLRGGQSGLAQAGGAEAASGAGGDQFLAVLPQ